MRHLRKYLLSAVYGLALSALGLPLGSLHAQTPQPNYGQAVGAGSSFNLSTENYLYGGPQLSVSNLTGCATGGSPSLVGDLYHAKLTAGTTTSTTCTITWPITRSEAPVCVLQLDTSGPVVPIIITVENTTTLTWTWGTTTPSTVWDIICMGRR